MLCLYRQRKQIFTSSSRRQRLPGGCVTLAKKLHCLEVSFHNKETIFVVSSAESRAKLEMSDKEWIQLREPEAKRSMDSLWHCLVGRWGNFAEQVLMLSELRSWAIHGMHPKEMCAPFFNGRSPCLIGV